MAEGEKREGPALEEETGEDVAAGKKRGLPRFATPMDLGPTTQLRVACLSSLDHLSEICRTEKFTCAALNITRYNRDFYEVEYLCNYKRVQDREFYLVKWKGYPESENSWILRKDLKCKDLLNVFHEDMETQLLKHRALLKLNGRRYNTGRNRLSPDVAEYLKMKGRQRIRLAAWQEELNQKKNHSAPILVENEVDLEGPPASFMYINEYQPIEGISVSKEPIVCCKCLDCPSELDDACCPLINFYKFAYNKHGRVKVKPGTPIFECNSLCQCGPECKNRIVQKGISYQLCIFRTDNGRGWGVKTMQPIKKNSFVMEYVGELIHTEEAERRGMIYDRSGTTYLFDLDFYKDEYTVDATFYGNVSHFVNHSCEPNLQVYSTFINNQELSQPRIAFFATDNIKVGEELTFDYNINVSDIAEDATDVHKSPIQTSPISMDNYSDSSSRALHGQVNSSPVANVSSSVSSDSGVSVPNGSISNGQVINTRVHNGLVSNCLVTNDQIVNSFSKIESINKDSVLHSTVTTTPKKRRRISCKCGASTCRQFLY